VVRPMPTAAAAFVDNLPDPRPADCQRAAGQPIGKAEAAALRRTLSEAGAFAHHTAASTAKLVVLLSAVAAMGALAMQLPVYLALPLVGIAALCLSSAAMIGHEGGHRSFARRPWQNELVIHLVFALMGGLGVLHWKHKHNVSHHGHPNVLGLDDDIELWPFAMSPAEYQQSGRFRRWFQRNLQGAMFWPLTTFLTFVMRVSSLRFSIAYLRRRGADRAWAADLGCQLGHYVLWLVVPSLVFGVVPALLWYGAVWAFVGLYLSLVFTPAHVGLPLVDGDPRGWLHQLTSTRDLRLPRWLSFFFIGLDHQVEHHLFPTIPHQNMPIASATLRAWCAEVGAPYQTIGYGDALVDVTRFMGRAWREAPVVASPHA
jgi:fatty acid desaturase